jgi:hypothetical protein
MASAWRDPSRRAPDARQRPSLTLSRLKRHGRLRYLLSGAPGTKAARRCLLFLSSRQENEATGITQRRDTERLAHRGIRFQGEPGLRQLIRRIDEETLDHPNKRRLTEAQATAPGSAALVAHRPRTESFSSARASPVAWGSSGMQLYAGARHRWRRRGLAAASPRKRTSSASENDWSARPTSRLGCGIDGRERPDALSKTFHEAANPSTKQSMRSRPRAIIVISNSPSCFSIWPDAPRQTLLQEDA